MKINSNYDPGDIAKIIESDEHLEIETVDALYNNLYTDDDLMLIRKSVRPCPVKHTKTIVATVENSFGDESKVTAKYCPGCGDRLIYE